MTVSAHPSLLQRQMTILRSLYYIQILLAVINLMIGSSRALNLDNTEFPGRRLLVHAGSENTKKVDFKDTLYIAHRRPLCWFDCKGTYNRPGRTIEYAFVSGPTTGHSMTGSLSLKPVTKDEHLQWTKEVVQNPDNFGRQDPGIPIDFLENVRKAVDDGRLYKIEKDGKLVDYLMPKDRVF